MQQLFPVNSNSQIEPYNLYGVPDLDFPSEGVALKHGERRPYIYFNLVSSVDGKITTQTDNAEGLGTRTDRTVMRRLRLASDAVLVGASTFRRDPIVPDTRPEFVTERHRYFPDAPHPLGMVLSSQGDLPLDNKFFQAPSSRRIVWLGPQATLETEQKLSAHARVLRLAEDTAQKPDLRQLLVRAYQELGIRRLLVEGGPTLNYSFIAQGWADELFWTLAPKIVGGSQNPSLVEGPGKGFDLTDLKKLQLVSIYAEASELFMRYKFKQ